MDYDTQAAWLIMEDEEEDYEEEMETVAAALIGATLLKQDEQRQERANRRQQTRQYLVRSELINNPRGETPWQILYRSRSDRGFITTMSIDVRTFDSILKAGFSKLWLSTPIIRMSEKSRSEYLAI